MRSGLSTASLLLLACCESTPREYTVATIDRRCLLEVGDVVVLHRSEATNNEWNVTFPIVDFTSCVEEPGTIQCEASVLSTLQPLGSETSITAAIDLQIEVHAARVDGAFSVTTSCSGTDCDALELDRCVGPTEFSAERMR
jgi:hypothetical protein